MPLREKVSRLGLGLAVLSVVVHSAGDGNVTIATIAAGVTAMAVAVFVRSAIPPPRFATTGVVAAAAALALVGVSPVGLIDVPIAVVLGFGVGLAVARPWPDHWMIGGAGTLALAGIRILFGPLASLRVAALVLVLAAVAVLRPFARARWPWVRLGQRQGALVAAGLLLTAGLGLWVAANDPTVEWFGHITTHASRSANEVALTFDDGPNDPYTLEVSRILDDHGAKGTFFEVGKAIDARPDIARALVADGQLVGNHSYHHDYWRWLDPGYPELDRTEDAFRRQLGLCPAFFRPPHGQRTPFMLARVEDRGMHTVTWDVSASDWTERDGAVVAAKILDRVRPGSIILLHDGLDGNAGADRSVLRTALPMILDGLAAKGLKPVRLDELLGQPGYLDKC
jgi:peptidoglycan/xylan/chitin deacetylase (PgdA/CDA1 family)